MSNMLQDAGSSFSFWIGLAIVLIVAVVGYIVARRSNAGPTSIPDTAKVSHDWMPTGRIDFAGPSMDESAADLPAAFYLQAEDMRLLISFSGIERKEIRWRKATLNEAKRVVNIFHRQMEKKLDSNTGDTFSTTVSAGEEAQNIAREEG
jgi:hypothetical protein